MCSNAIYAQRRYRVVFSDSRSSVLLPQRVVSGNALWRRKGDSEGAQALEDERRSLQARKSAGSRVAGGPALRENVRAAPVPLGGTTSGYGSTAGDLAGRGSATLNSPAERRQRRAPLRESTGSSIAGQSPGPFRTSAVRGVRALAANGMAAQGPLGARQTWQQSYQRLNAMAGPRILRRQAGVGIERALRLLAFASLLKTPMARNTTSLFDGGLVVADRAMGARCAVAADFDGDGRLDLVSASSNDNAVSWHRNLGIDSSSGKLSFSIKKQITWQSLGSRIVTVADIDMDGDVDVVGASYYDSTVRWFENDGTGKFTPHIISTAVNEGQVSVRCLPCRLLVLCTACLLVVSWWLPRHFKSGSFALVRVLLLRT